MKIDLELFFQLQALYTDYALAVDSGHWDAWPEFFTDECEYKLQPRENHERNKPGWYGSLMFSSISFQLPGMRWRL